jgi:hypothetical protein
VAAVRPLWRRYGFAVAYLGAFLAVGLACALLDPATQARVIAWASTDVANLEHEPVGPLLLSALVTPEFFAAWPVLIGLAVFGANRALGNLAAALVCLAGHVIGTLVSEGIVAYRIHDGQLPVADRYLPDVGPSYVVVAAVVIALACGSRLARALAAVALVVLVFPGHIFAGLSQLDLAAVGHLTAIVTAAAATALILARRRRRQGRDPNQGRDPGQHAGSAGHVADGRADQVGDPGRAGAQGQLAQGPTPERPAGQPSHQAPADDGGDGGEPQRDRHQVQAGQVRDERDDRADRERGQRRAGRYHRRGQLAGVYA